MLEGLEISRNKLVCDRYAATRLNGFIIPVRSLMPIPFGFAVTSRYHRNP